MTKSNWNNHPPKKQPALEVVDTKRLIVVDGQVYKVKKLARAKAYV